MANIRRITESRRGCGERSKGGFYLRIDGQGFLCKTMPIGFKPCDCCGSTHAPKRSLVKVPTPFIYKCIERDFEACEGKSIPFDKLDPQGPSRCDMCPMNTFLRDTTFLVVDWVGAGSYPSVESFVKESATQGISRRVAIRKTKDGELVFPIKDFEFGRDWIGLGHVRANITIGDNGAQADPGIFMLYKPDRIEYVVEGTESEKELDELEAAGIDLVDVHYPPKPTQGKLFEGDDQD